MGDVTSIGEAANRVMARTRELMLKSEAHLDAPRFIRLLQSAAIDAKDRAAEIALTTRGFLVRKGCKVEIVTWEQADVGMLNRALDRVAPYPIEISG